MTEAEESAAISACRFEEGLCLAAMGRPRDAAGRFHKAIEAARRAGGVHRPAQMHLALCRAQI